MARNLFKLMAYKDEVARLHADGSFAARIAQQFEGDVQLHFHLAPLLLAKTNDRGELVKQRYGPWMMTAFTWLARLKGLRGTAFDVFGRTEERRQERAWIKRYQAMLEEVCRALDAGQGAEDGARYQNALSLAQIPQDIRGFGHVKARHSALAMEKWRSLIKPFQA